VHAKHIESPRSSFRRNRNALSSSSRAPVQLRVARTAADLEDTRLVRSEVYGAEKGFVTDDQLFDEYDDRAVILNVYAGEEPIATARITDTSKTGLEIFDMHPELKRLVRPERYIEISRLMALRPFRGGYRATLPIIRFAARYVLEVNATGAVISCAKPLIPYYEKIGFRALCDQPLAHQRLRGLVDYPMVFEPGHGRATAAQKAFWYFIERDVYRWMARGRR
jgi:hypothetical protein